MPPLGCLKAQFALAEVHRPSDHRQILSSRLGRVDSQISALGWGFEVYREQLALGGATGGAMVLVSRLGTGAAGRTTLSEGGEHRELQRRRGSVFLQVCIETMM